MEANPVNTRSFLLRLMLLVVIIITIIWLITAIRQVNDDANIVLGEEASPRSPSLSEEGFDTAYLVLENREVLSDNFFRNTYDKVVNQIYTENYKLHGSIERFGTVTNYVKNSDNTYSFSVRFSPSNNVVDVNITVTDLASNFYTLNVKKGS